MALDEWPIKKRRCFMTVSSDPRANGILAALPEEEWRRLEPSLEWVELPLGARLHETGKPHGYVYFPVSGIVSLVYVMANGESAEIAVIGCEGMVGVSLFMGVDTTPSRAVVQSAGAAYRVNARVMQRAHEKGVPVTDPVLRFVQALMIQIAQTAVCNRHHLLDQQLCRWLLLSLDRLPGSEVVMTQEFIASMLGVRREGVTESASKLQKAGLIRYSRGRITVVDHEGLKLRSCECYEVVRREYERLLAK
jgi:CRP-like cAMP-binding protein